MGKRHLPGRCGFLDCGSVEHYRKPCDYCDRPAQRFCDFPNGLSGTTCDRLLCSRHAFRLGSEDLCRQHKRAALRLAESLIPLIDAAEQFLSARG